MGCFAASNSAGLLFSVTLTSHKFLMEKVEVALLIETLYIHANKNFYFFSRSNNRFPHKFEPVDNLYTKQTSQGINCRHLTIENVFAPKNVSVSKFNFGLPKVAKL